MYRLTAIKQCVDEFSLTIDNCEFQKGKIYAITGPNGSGKTTLMDILAFIKQPTSGNINFNNQLVDYRDSAALLKTRRSVGCLMQNPYLFNMNVFNNVAYGLKIRKISSDIITEKVSNILEQLNLIQLASRRARSLSKGEAQRVALARTLVIDTPVYLLDEPSANVDKANINTIEETLQVLKQKKNATIIFSTHSSKQAERIADETLELDMGKII
jgi:tungstate transport system ATP-binding protein